MTKPHPEPDRHAGQTYEVRLRGHLHPRWATRLDVPSLTLESDGTTTLRGVVVDQAALHGLLQRVRDLGLTLVSVISVGSDLPETFTSDIKERKMSVTASISDARLGLTAARPAKAQSIDRGKTDPQLLAKLTGLLFLITYATSIPPYVALYVPALSDPAFILGGGIDFGLSWGALLEMLLIIANIGSAVALYPVLKRQNEALSLGFIAARIAESVFIAVGILSMLALASLRAQGTGVENQAMLTVGQALAAIHDLTFLLGPGFIVGIGNGLILGYLMWTSRLVPRAMSILGLIGGPALVAAAIAIMFGFIEQGSSWQLLATMPEFFWELSLGIWLLAKGFNPAALAALGNVGSDETN